MISAKYWWRNSWAIVMWSLIFPWFFNILACLMCSLRRHFALETSTGSSRSCPIRRVEKFLQSWKFLSKKIILSLQAAAPDQPPVSLSTQLTAFLSRSSGQTRLGILQFLSIWCSDCSQAVAIFLQEGKLVSTLQGWLKLKITLL